MRFLIWGGGGHGRMVGDLLRALGEEIAGYVDQDPKKLGTAVEPLGSPVSHVQAELTAKLRSTGRYPGGVDASALGIGNNRLREACLGELDALEVPWLIHPSATVSEAARLGRGTVVFPHAVINAGSRIGDAVIVNSGAIIEHDCELDTGVHVSPGAVLCGGVKAGRRAWIGAGATIIHAVRIGDDVVVGAGSTVLEDIQDGSTVVGSPARPVAASRNAKGRR